MKATTIVASLALLASVVLVSASASRAADEPAPLLQVAAVAFTPAELADHYGMAALSGLAAAIAALPPGNTVQSQINGNPPTTITDSSSATFSTTQGGTTVTTTASTNGSGTFQQPNPVVISEMISRTRSISRSRTIFIKIGG